MKRTVLTCLLVATLALAGCGPDLANPTALKAMHKVALVSVSLDKVTTGPGNDLIQQQAVDYAGMMYQKQTQALPLWQVVPAEDPAAIDRHFDNLAASPIVNQVLSELADRNQLPGEVSNAMIAKAAMLAFRGGATDMEQLKKEMFAETIAQMQKDVDTARGNMVAAKGLATIPFNYSRNEKINDALSTIEARVIADYCQKHGLDGVIQVFQLTAVGKPADIRVIVQGNRVLSSLKLNPALVVRDRDGKIVFNTGSPRLDDLAPLKLAMPIYTGTKNARGMMDNLKLDLNDPAGTSLAGYNELIEETAPKRVGQLKAVLQP